MYAIVLRGGKQYKVTENEKFDVEKLDVESGTINLEVLMLVDGDKVTVGNPLVAGAVVEAEVQGSFKGTKLFIFRYKAKKNVRKRQGHRQPYTRLKVLAIKA